MRKWEEHKDIRSYEEAPGRDQRGSGIYVLYKGDKVYYVGLSTVSIRGRLRMHATKDGHKGELGDLPSTKSEGRNMVRILSQFCSAYCRSVGQRQ